MWADNETSEDLLGFKVHADLIVDVIKDDTVLPVTIGVFGDWGSGKSSILRIIKEELTGPDKNELKDGTLTLYFNGWVFEGYDDAKAALLESIIDKFAQHEKLKNKILDQTGKLLRSVKWMRVLGLGFKKIVLPTAAAYFSGGLTLVPYLINEFAKFNPEDLANKLTSENCDDFLKDILHKDNEEDESRLVREFRLDFKEMIDKSEIKKLVVIIDDLDRCTPERIIENLEAIKLFLNVDKTAFVIGADPRIVRHAIEYRYKTDKIEFSDDIDSNNKRIVSDYLEKLIQIPYNLPKLSDHEVETYMTLLFCKKELSKESFNKVLLSFYEHQKTNRYGAFGIGNIDGIIQNSEQILLSESVSLIASLASVITVGLNGNPRQIKRFLNTFMLRKRLVKIANIENFKYDILVKIMILEYSEPSLFRKIYEWQVSQSGEPNELIELENLAKKNNKEIINEKYSSSWSSDALIRWLSIEPVLARTDLRDYFWISRDQLEKSISGSSLIPPYIRALCQKILNHGSGKILSNIVTTEIKNKLNEQEIGYLFPLLEKELLKAPENKLNHIIFIELISQKIPSAIECYKRLIKLIDNSKIPFSLRSDFTLAEKNNEELKTLYKIFNPDSQIYKALNPK